VSGCAFIIWLAGIAAVVSFLRDGVAQLAASCIWTVVLVVAYAISVERARKVDERRRWERQEATRLRKKAWRDERRK